MYNPYQKRKRKGVEGYEHNDVHCWIDFICELFEVSNLIMIMILGVTTLWFYLMINIHDQHFDS